MTMRRLFIVVACLLAAGWNGHALSQTVTGDGAGRKSPNERFEALLAQAQKDPGKADWKALRTAFAATSHYEPYNIEWRREIAKVGKDVEEGKLKAAEAMLVKLLERERFMRLDGHAVAIALYEKMGESEKAREHRSFLEGLSNAVFVPGAGMSFEKPIEVLFLEEEYLVLGSLGLRVKQQALSEHNGHRFDVLTTQAKGDQPERRFYFNVDLPQQALHKSLERSLEPVKKPGPKQ